MKKILSFALCAALLAVLAVMPVSAQFALSANKGTVTIDGVKDDIYGDMFEIKAMRDAAGATGKVWLAWDDKNIYNYVEVNDTTPNHNHENAWEVDCVEFFIDWNSSEGEDPADTTAPYWQIRIASAANDAGVQVTGNFNRTDINDDTGIQYKVVPISGSDLKGGYIIEMAMPHNLAENAKPLTEGMTIKVDYQVADNQDGTVRASQAFLTSDDMDDQYNRAASCHGVITLLGAPSAPAAVEEPAAPAAVEEAPAATDAPAAAAPAPTTTAPVTGDTTVILVIIAVLSLGAVITWRRKAVR